MLYTFRVQERRRNRVLEDSKRDLISGTVSMINER